MPIPNIIRPHPRRLSSITVMRVATAGIAMALVLAVTAGRASSAQDKYSLKVPNGPAFSEFRGYEDWQTVSVSQTESSNVIRVILANPVMIKAYRSGIPRNGKPFPEGSKIAKILWNQQKITDDPFSEAKPDTAVGSLQAVELIEKSTKRFPDTHGWGYAEFSYDAPTDSFKLAVKDAKCGAQCHELAASTDYIFNAYAKR